MKQVKLNQLMQGLGQALSRRVQGPCFYMPCYAELWDCSPAHAATPDLDSEF